MPLYDYQCKKCGHIFESIQPVSSDTIKCISCEDKANRIITCSGAYMGNQDATWLKNVCDVVGDSRADTEFKKNPTRLNYERMMKSNGIRPLEPGEKPINHNTVDTSSLQKKVLERHMERNSITLRG